MTGLKDQCFGVEVEMTGITRKQAAQALADYFGTIPKAKGGVYDTWKVKDPTGKEWKLVSDASIIGEQWTGTEYLENDIKDFRVELVTRSEEHTSELQSQFRISYAVFCLKKKKIIITPRYSI